MRFFKQIRFEIKNIIRSRFLLVIGIIIISAGIIVPAISYYTQKRYNNIYPPGPVYREYSSDIGIINGKYDYYGYGDGGETITIDGIEIRSDNPFFWNLMSLQQERQSIENNQVQFVHAATADVLLEMIDAEKTYYLRFAKVVTSYQDYRTDLAGRGFESLSDKFFYENGDVDADVLQEAASYRKGIDPTSFLAKYVNITAAERLAGLAKAEDYLDMIIAIVENDDFARYIGLRVQMANDNIANLEKTIAIQQQAIIDNPAQEESLNQYIEELRRQIKVIRESEIPLLQYRLEKNIRPGKDVWQNNALNDIENSQNQLAYMTIMTEEEFNKNQGPSKRDIYYDYGPYPGTEQTYEEYVASMQRQIDQLNKTIIIAKKSIDANKPDMKYVPQGARSMTNSFLDYSIFVALFGVLLGGWLIASEHQQGTIRLLMIRPRTRTKILLAKFTAALLICIMIDAAGSLVNVLANGAFFGFADYLNPNYTVTAAISFPFYYLPRFLACILPILFAYSIAFMLSVLLRNTAVSITLPIVFFIASMITMTMVAYNKAMSWIIYTPLPFIQLSSFFKPYSMIQYMQQSGVAISLTYGIVLLFALSVAFVLVSTAVFKRRDITN